MFDLFCDLGATDKQTDFPAIYAIGKLGLAKREEEVFVRWADEPVVLPAGSASLFLVKRVRDEAHRFAVEYHRALRGKAMTASVLDDIEGVGPKRKKALLRHFGSLRRLREATAEEIAEVPGVPREVAVEIAAVLAQGRG